jgi:hypothetical protein
MQGHDERPFNFEFVGPTDGGLLFHCHGNQATSRMALIRYTTTNFLSFRAGQVPRKTTEIHGGSRWGYLNETGGQAKSAETPHVCRFPNGWLKYGNAPYDMRKGKRCGARNRRGSACGSPAMRNGRCRLHGGLSTGPKTAEGIERIRRANTKHGLYSAAAIAERKRFRDTFNDCREVVFAAKRVFWKRTNSCGTRPVDSPDAGTCAP